MIIPLICADGENIEVISNEIPLNYYFGGNINDLADKPADFIENELNTIKKGGYQISMIHAFAPNDVRQTYAANRPYFNFIRSLGRVGLTIHYKYPRNPEDVNILFQQILWMYAQCPEAVWYIENESNDLYGVLQMVQALRSLKIESYMLIDTCHLQMDLAPYKRILYNTDEVMLDTIEMYSDYIGAFHISCSVLHEGYNIDEHGRPPRDEKDIAYLNKLVGNIKSLDFKNDIYLIPEVSEKDYSPEGGRKEGLKTYELFNKILFH